MNCEKCQDLISDFLDGTLSQEDQSTLNSHLEECLGCSSVRTDLQSLVGFCRTQRGQYSAPPNEKALWLRIRNVIEAEASTGTAAPAPASRNFWTNWLSRSWELSFPQLAASAESTLHRLGYRNVKIRVGDGSRGWPEYAPFDAILVSAATSEMPPALFAQLREGGRMVVPIGPASSQELQLIRKVGGEPEVTFLEGCRFVPLVEGTA